MKFLTTNFVQCAVRSCAKSGSEFPLKYDVNPAQDLAHQPTDFDPMFVINIVPKLDWQALVLVARELGNESLPSDKPDLDMLEEDERDTLIQNLHSLLVETRIMSGQAVCRNCGHIYHIKNGIANFLLPPHLAN